MGIFQRLNRERGLTVIFVTHEPEIAYHTRRIIHLRDSLLFADELCDEPLLADPDEQSPSQSRRRRVFPSA